MGCVGVVEGGWGGRGEVEVKVEAVMRQCADYSERGKHTGGVEGWKGAYQGGVSASGVGREICLGSVRYELCACACVAHWCGGGVFVVS